MFASGVPGALRCGAGASPRFGVPSALNTPGLLPPCAPGVPGAAPGRLRVPTPKSSPRCGVGHAPGFADGVVPVPACAAGCVPLPGDGGPPPGVVAAVVPDALAFAAGAVPACADGCVPRDGIGNACTCARTAGTCNS